jgi:Prenyltransferase and squalene oxidase repeat
VVAEEVLGAAVKKKLVALIALFAVLLVAGAGPGPSGEKRRKRPPRKKTKKKTPKKKPKKKDPKKKPKKEDDDERKLLAEMERRKGATFPGRDPAFLVLPRPSERSRMVKELLTPEVREMTKKALQYLARSQDADGGWSDTQFQSNTGVTALCCLALMGEGSRPRIGKYGKNLNRGIEFLLKNVKKGSGVIAGKGSNKYGPMYEHALSTQALLLAWGDMPWKGDDIRRALTGAVEALKKSQRQDGGWRYQVSNQGNSDMSVTANVLWVLRTAKKCGFTVRQQSIDKGTNYIQQCALPDGTFRYRYWGLHASPSLGGTGVIALMNQGRIDHKLIPPARDRIAYEYRRYTIKSLKERRYFVYGAFYASLATYACGDKYWLPWYKKSAAVLKAMQRKDGEFYDQHDNVVYPTAMALTILQAPLGYLPIYER